MNLGLCSKNVGNCKTLVLQPKLDYLAQIQYSHCEKNQIFVRKSIENDKIEILNGRFFFKSPIFTVNNAIFKKCFHPFWRENSKSFSQNFKGENSRTKTKIRKNFGVKIQSLLHSKIQKEKIQKQKRK